MGLWIWLFALLLSVHCDPSTFLVIVLRVFWLKAGSFKFRQIANHNNSKKEDVQFRLNAVHSKNIDTEKGTWRIYFHDEQLFWTVTFSNSGFCDFVICDFVTL